MPMDFLQRRQGHVCQPETAEPGEAAEAEHHVVKAARKDELSPRLTPQGQALLQASRAVTRAIQPSAGSMREAYLHSLGFKCAPLSLGTPSNDALCNWVPGSSHLSVCATLCCSCPAFSEHKQNPITTPSCATSLRLQE